MRASEYVLFMVLFVLVVFCTAATASVIVVMKHTARHPVPDHPFVPYWHHFLGSEPFKFLFVCLVIAQVFMTWKFYLVLSEMPFRIWAPVEKNESYVRKPISEVEIKKCKSSTTSGGATSTQD